MGIKATDKSGKCKVFINTSFKLQYSSKHISWHGITQMIHTDTFFPTMSQLFFTHIPDKAVTVISTTWKTG